MEEVKATNTTKNDDQDNTPTTPKLTVAELKVLRGELVEKIKGLLTAEDFAGLDGLMDYLKGKKLAELENDVASLEELLVDIKTTADNTPNDKDNTTADAIQTVSETPSTATTVKN